MGLFSRKGRCPDCGKRMGRRHDSYTQCPSYQRRQVRDNDNGDVTAEERREDALTDDVIDRMDDVDELVALIRADKLPGVDRRKLRVTVTEMDDYDPMNPDDEAWATDDQKERIKNGSIYQSTLRVTVEHPESGLHGEAYRGGVILGEIEKGNPMRFDQWADEHMTDPGYGEEPIDEAVDDLQRQVNAVKRDFLK